MYILSKKKIRRGWLVVRFQLFSSVNDHNIFEGWIHTDSVFFSFFTDAVVNTILPFRCLFFSFLALDLFHHSSFRIRVFPPPFTGHGEKLSLLLALVCVCLLHFVADLSLFSSLFVSAVPAILCLCWSVVSHGFVFYCFSSIEM
uniref:Uncharacterized protein n=1 Tax=Trypanosoma congolense (strain IL3000) TaxID=1068625 RepID=G0ULS0_TRYCI|nr:hypothetical protein, unlikely [Trypanosoma congolense IL3000]